MTDTANLTSLWRDVCRRAVTRQKALLGDYPQGAAAQQLSASGAGGDTTLRIDLDFEQIVIDEIQKAESGLGALRIVTEERGSISQGNGEQAAWVIIDPVDGSTNAAQGMPQFSLSVAVARGERMTDVWFGYVFDFGTGEEFVADDRGYLSVNGAPAGEIADTPYHIVGCESAEPALLARGLAELAGGGVQEIRVIGSIAICLCYVALGRFDGMFTCKDCRSVDVAAGQLIARQTGREVYFDGESPANAALDLDARYRLVSGLGSLASELRVAQQAIPLVPR